MQNPVTGRVSSEWSKNRVHPVTRLVTSHAGIDIAAAIGTPVVAAFCGKVLEVRTNSYAGDTRLWKGLKSGNFVVIQNPDGAVQWYGHLHTVLVKAGDTVREGQTIGTVGMTGVVTGPHLHFECWSKNEIASNFDPRILFDRYKLTPGVSALGPVVTVASVKPVAKAKRKAKTYKTVKRGSIGATVRNVQKALRKQRYTKQRTLGIFDAQTEANVKDFQRRTGLYEDGIAGPITQKKLGL